MAEKNIFEQRIDKLDAIKSSGKIAYPNDFKVTATSKDVIEKFGSFTKEELEQQEKTELSLAGRVIFRRSFGKAAFLKIKDRNGMIQSYVAKNSLTEDEFKIFDEILDIGDIIGITGYPFVTKTGELSIHATSFRVLTKSLNPLPEKFHGLTDIEARYRQRYVDLIVNDESKDRFIKRAQIIRSIRNFLDKKDFIEVETPMLHSIAGGAAARPFTTHHNTLNMDLYMRIAPELHLKRLVVGGIERVYEINRCFRNEGISTRHNPEFTTIEFYHAYATYQDLMDLTEEMLKTVALETLGTTSFIYQGIEIDFGKPFERLSVYDGIKKYLPDYTEEIFTSFEAAKEFAKSKGVKIENYFTHGKILMELFEFAAEEHLLQPTFVTDFPLDVSPLSRKKDSDPTLVDRFEIYVAGFELGNAFSELNDPLDQEERFIAQLKDKEAGDAEAHQMDEDYIRALKYGLPPTAGEGIGIDRLAMLLTDAPSIRDVILFPQLKQE
ncbi:lysine--tRNA ligase [bacterium]|nr:lysine--tRNA ligase [bacterium]